RATAAPTRSPSGSSTRSSTASHRPTRDYTLVLSRVMFISKHAKHPNAAKLWTDFVLSQRGQKIIGDAIELFAVRDDVDARYSAAALRERIGSAARPIPVDPKIAAPLDDKQQRDLIVGWKTALTAARETIDF